MDPSVVDVVMTSIGAAAGAYGRAVLTDVDNMAADGTVRLGQRLLARLRRIKHSGAQIETAVRDVAEHPEDQDFQVALRAQIKKAVEADPDLEADLVALLKAGGVTISATGARAVAVQHNEGIVSTGDNAVNRIQGR